MRRRYRETPEDHQLFYVSKDAENMRWVITLEEREDAPASQYISWRLVYDPTDVYAVDAQGDRLRLMHRIEACLTVEPLSRAEVTALFERHKALPRTPRFDARPDLWEAPEHEPDEEEYDDLEEMLSEEEPEPEPEEPTAASVAWRTLSPDRKIEL